MDSLISSIFLISVTRAPLQTIVLNFRLNSVPAGLPVFSDDVFAIFYFSTGSRHAALDNDDIETTQTECYC